MTNWLKSIMNFVWETLLRLKSHLISQQESMKEEKRTKAQAEVATWGRLSTKNVIPFVTTRSLLICLLIDDKLRTQANCTKETSFTNRLSMKSSWAVNHMNTSRENLNVSDSRTNGNCTFSISGNTPQSVLDNQMNEIENYLHYSEAVTSQE